MTITKKTSTTNTKYLVNRPITYIVIHYTAGTTSKKGAAINGAAWGNSSSAGGSADFYVDDVLIVQKNPDIKNRYCYAVGGDKKKYDVGNGGGEYYGKATNINCISIEICSNNDTGKMTAANDGHYTFTEKAVKNAEELCKELMAEYDIPVNRVIRHFSVNCKPCPGVLGWGTNGGDDSAWKAFKASLTASSKATTASTDTSFKVRLKTAMNIRKGPSTSYMVMGVCPVGTYTIAKVENTNWGYLKSGAGWINISDKYATKV